MPCPSMHATDDTVLEVDGLCVDFTVRSGTARILFDISFTVARGETLGIVGESGCGKSMTALALMRMIPSPPGQISSGRIVLNGENLCTATESRMRELRGSSVSMVFQEPMTSLNPVYTVGDQIAETIRRHKKTNRAESLKGAVDLLRLVQIPAPERRVRSYPHELSGGMRQRVMIAMALACEPDVLIADEPTTALDVTVQSQILDLLREIQDTRGTSIVLITHDFGVISEMSDRVSVMYAGHNIEEGTAEEIENEPFHPYTRGLLGCMLDVKFDGGRTREPLPEIPGVVPDLLRGMSGCPFAPRCSLAFEKCGEMPPSFRLGHKRLVKCWLAEPETQAEEQS